MAKHLWQLKNIDFKNTMVLSDEEIRIIGTRYNRGPQISLGKIKLNTSYGDFILRIKSRLLALIG